MVKSYNRKGFGFLMVMGADYGQDIYYTRDQLSPKLQTRDIPGQHVTFELVRFNDGKLSAINIRPPGDNKEEGWCKGSSRGSSSMSAMRADDEDRTRDWVCPRCTERNFVKRFECFKCGTSKPLMTGSSPSAPSSSSHPPARSFSPHAGSRAVRDALAGGAGRGRDRERSRSPSRRKQSSSESEASSSSSEKAKKRKKNKKKRKQSSSSSSRSSSKSSDCQIGDVSAAPASSSKKRSTDPEIEKAKSEALQELMRLRGVEPKETRMSEWRALLRKWHPDKNPERVEVATEVFQFLQKGKAILDGASGTAAG